MLMLGWICDLYLNCKQYILLTLVDDFAKSRTLHFYACHKLIPADLVKYFLSIFLEFILYIMMKSLTLSCVGQACLYYSWRQSATDPEFSVRECLDTSVLLGPITSPLLPEPGCSVRDVSEDSDGSIVACLCQTDYCNVATPGNVSLTNRPRTSYTPTSTLPPRRGNIFMTFYQHNDI